MNLLSPMACLVALGSLGLAAPAGAKLQTASAPAPFKMSARKDALGWPLPEGAIARLGSLRFGVGVGPVGSLAFSPDGQLLASTGGRESVYIWQVSTGREIRRFDKTKPDYYYRLAYAPIGELLALVANDGIHLFQVASGREAHHFPIEGHHILYGITFSTDGQKLAASVDERVYVWDVPSKRRLCVFEGHTDRVLAVAFAPDGKTVVSGSDDQSIRSWDAVSGREFWAVREQGGPISSLAYAPDGRFLVSANYSPSPQHSVCFWHANNGKLARRLVLSEREEISALAFSPDGKQVAGAAVSGTLHFWESGFGREVRRMDTLQGHLMALCFSPDGKSVAVGGMGSKIGLWDVATGESLVKDSGDKNGVDSIAYSPDGHRLASGGCQQVIMWDLRSLKEAWQAKIDTTVLSLAFAPDGSKLAYGTNNCIEGAPNFEQGNSFPSLVILAADNGRELQHFPKSRPMDPILSTAFSPDGRILAAAHGIKSTGISLWSLPVNQKPQSVDLPAGSTWCLAISPDGKLLASGAEDSGNTYIWDVARGVEIARFSHDTMGASSVAFSPDGTMLLSAERTNGIVLRHVPDGKVIGTIDLPQPDRFSGGFSAVFSNNGKMIASGGYDGSIHLWEVATRQERMRFTGHESPVSKTAFSPDDAQLASAGWDSTILLWDVWHGPPTSTKALNPEVRQRLWEELRNSSAAKAYQAMCELAQDTQAAIVLLENQLHPLQGISRDKLRNLVERLGSDSFAEREHAYRELEPLGGVAEPVVRQVLAQKPAPEVSRRLQQLLEAWQSPVSEPDKLRELRAVELVEHIGTARAQQVLEKLSQGASSAQVTREAQGALERLSKRPACRSGS